MLLVALTLWAIMREDAITQGLQVLKTEYYSEHRYPALDAMLQFDGIRDRRVMDYYRVLWKNRDFQDPNKPRIFFLEELTNPRFYCKEIKALLVEFLDSKGVATVGMLRYLYRIRNHWWNDRKVVELLQARLKKFYHVVWDEKMAPIGKNAPLAHWLDMCKYRALIGDKSMAKVYEDNLADKRELQNLRNFAGPEIPYEPQPSRVCDYMLLASLQLGQVDIRALFDQYGYREIELRDYHDRLIAIYDQVIREFPTIKKQYLK